MSETMQRTAVLQDIIKAVQNEVKGAELRLATHSSFSPRKLKLEIPPLDKILGGGLPFGRITLIKGDFSSGKTFLAQKAFVAAQRQGLSCALIDVERSLDPEWFTVTGVELSRLIVTQPSSGEEALDIAVALVKAGTDLVVLDSVAALVPISEVEEGMDHQFVGALARLFNKGLRKITRENKGHAVFVAINQLRQGIGAAPFPTEALPAGKGQWFFSSIVLDVRRGPWIKEKNDAKERRIGFQIHVRTEKNRLAPPQQTCVLPFIFEGGVIDTIRGVLDLALDLHIIRQQGSLYEHKLFPGGKVRGRLGIVELLQEHPEIHEALQKQVQDGNDKNGNLRTEETS